jgi:hypothetical protein
MPWNDTVPKSGSVQLPAVRGSTSLTAGGDLRPGVLAWGWAVLAQEFSVTQAAGAPLDRLEPEPGKDDGVRFPIQNVAA